VAVAELERRPIPSPNYSSRGGAAVRLIVLHTAEGARSIEELGAFFASSSSGVSSHVGIDDTAGVIGEYVKRSGKAWTQGDANPVAVSAELCAFADWDRAEWERHPAMLENAARWIAEEAAYFSIPLVELSPPEAQASGRGVCQHADLGSWGGGHWDCGGAFPIDDVLELARGGEEADVGYPEWFWDWAEWYLTTDRDAAHRPPQAPAEIPEWAWDGLDDVNAIAKRNGMSAAERDWIAWYLDGKQGERPDVPTDIPEKWWPDEAFVLEREKAAR
jgi:N-acetylmuramoyl-L-alanine amidase-like protein